MKFITFTVGNPGLQKKTSLLELSELLEWSKVGHFKDLEESAILLVRKLLLRLKSIKIILLKDVPELELEKLECWEILS